jgi:serine protease
MALAPILTLAACDQMTAILDQMRGAAKSPAVIESLDARAVGGAVLPAAAMDEMLDMPPVAFVPGEVLVGAKIEQQLAQAQGLSIQVFSRMVDGAGGGAVEGLEIDPKMLEAATQAAVDKARRDAETVLRRMGVQGSIEVGAGGVVKVDLTPETASPTQLPVGPDGAPVAAPEAASPAEPETPDAALETGERCPRSVTPEQLQADAALATQCAVERLRASRQFEFAEKNYIFDLSFDRIPWPKPPAAPTSPAPAPSAPSAPQTVSLPNEPLLPLQWEMRPRGSGVGQSPGGAGFETFWLQAKQTGSRDVRVAVIDTGIDTSHPDFRGAANLGKGIDLISNWDRSGDADGVDSDPSDAGDKCGPAGVNSFHGSHVAGSVGAAGVNKGRGTVGVAWNVTVLPIRALGRCGGELDDIVNGIRWATGLAPAETEKGELIVNRTPADIINMSLSVPIACPASMQAAIDAVNARGVVVVVAAGNNANPTGGFAPANCRNVVVVGANDAQGRMAFYSNFGPEVTLLAPGGDLFADSDKDGRPDGILSTRTTQADCFDPQTKTAAAVCYYSYLQGTSMAAPQVAGALALLKAQTKTSGKALVDTMLARAVSPVDPAMCEVSCDRAKKATPIPDKPGMCRRACGVGMLDMARAAQATGPALGAGR